MRPPAVHADNGSRTATRQRIAVVGGGISGLSCAWLLARRHDVTLYESSEHVGGHACTVEVTFPKRTVPVDVGFIVFNERTYPNFTALLSHLDVPTTRSDMSFAVSLDDGRLEYSGTDLAGLFAQKRNLLRPRFWSMLRDLNRLYRTAPEALAALERERAHPGKLTTLGAWLEGNRFGAALSEDHLLPMAGAIWSCGAGAVLDHPAGAFLRFCHNHGLLQLTGRPVWRSITGGSGVYVGQLLQQFLAAPHAQLLANTGVLSVRRDDNGVLLRDVTGTARRFDAVAMAGHAPQSLALLEDADQAERAALSPFRTTQNRAVLHCDESLMPRRRAAWSSWNHLGVLPGSDSPCVTYWMNRLQALGDAPNLFVTLNPGRLPRPGTLLHSVRWQHPQFDEAALRAQDRLWALQGSRRTWFCGAWLGDGFHEDGLQAGLAVAEALGGVQRPWQVEDESGRMPRGRLPHAPVSREAVLS